MFLSSVCSFSGEENDHVLTNSDEVTTQLGDTLL